jgi:hypothetical protein
VVVVCGVWCSTPLSIIFQLYRGGQFYLYAVKYYICNIFFTEENLVRQERMDNPETLARMGNPETLARMDNPETLARMDNPETLARMGNPETLARMGNPETLARMGNPETLARLETRDTEQRQYRKRKKINITDTANIYQLIYVINNNNPSDRIYVRNCISNGFARCLFSLSEVSSL